ncbi:MAG: ribokinase [Loktanella sp.]|nr:ribokinase [Loktanella sp.]
MSGLLQMTGPVLDLVYRVAAFPVSGQEAVVTGFDLYPGGGYNAMYAARQAGMDVALGGSLGTGPLADTILAAMQETGITCAGMRTPDIDQGCCTVIMEPDGERSFLAFPGAEGRITLDTLDRIDMSAYSWVLLSGYSLHYPQARTALSSWAARLPDRVRLLFDPSPVIAELPDAILAPVMARADWISANAQEAAVLTGQQDATAAVTALARGRHGAVLRQGADGAVVSFDGTTQKIAPHNVQAIDTNGAGDTHIGSFIALLDRIRDPIKAAHYANVAAALSATRSGPATAPAAEKVLPYL